MFALCLSVLLIQNMYTELDADKEIEIANGEEFIVKLTSNPSTGYQWILESNNFVKQVGPSRYEETNKNPDIVGAPVKQIFKFKATKSGMHIITLRYSRVWDPKVTDKAYKLVLKIK